MLMPTDPRLSIVALLSDLRAFSGSLAGDPGLADDLLQETLIKAWTRFESFRPGTNLRAWLFTILRNEFYSHHRRRRREAAVGGAMAIDRAATGASQDDHMEMVDLRRALARLNIEQREALVLSAAAGFSYEEVAQICGCAIGTVKSRINRARIRLAHLLTDGSGEGAGPKAPPPGRRATTATTRSWRHGAAHARPGHGGAGLGRRAETGGCYCRPEDICHASELDWADKLQLLIGWRTRLNRDMRAGALDRTRGDAMLGELNQALRRMAGSAFLDGVSGT